MTKTELMTLCKSLNIDVQESDFFVSSTGMSVRVTGKENAHRLSRAVHEYYTKLGYAGSLNLDDNAPYEKWEKTHWQERAKFKSMH